MVIGAALLIAVLASSGHVLRVTIRRAEAVTDPIAPGVEDALLAPQIIASRIAPRIDASPTVPRVDPVAITPGVAAVPVLPKIDPAPTVPRLEPLPVAPPVDASPIVGRMHDELATAASITWADGSTISFTVPDRDNDGVEESLDYRLKSGRLVRTCNGLSSALMDNVQQLSFEYQLSISDEEVTATVTGQSAEVVLAYHDGYPVRDYYHAVLDMTPDRQWAHRFEVTDLPEGAVSFTITYVMIHARKLYDSSTGPLILSMERPVSPTQGWPDGNVLDQATIDISAMMTFPGWHRVNFSNLKNIPVEDNVFCLRVYGGAALECSVWASYLDRPPGPDDGQQVYYTHDGGASWNPGRLEHDGDLRFYAYGTFATAHTVEENARVQRITGVQITLTPRGSDLAFSRFAQLAREPAYDVRLSDLELGSVPDQPIVIEDAPDLLPLTPLTTDPPEI
jgi:hypothetical protein